MLRVSFSLQKSRPLNNAGHTIAGASERLTTAENTVKFLFNFTAMRPPSGLLRPVLPLMRSAMAHAHVRGHTRIWGSLCAQARASVRSRDRSRRSLIYTLTNIYIYIYICTQMLIYIYIYIICIRICICVYIYIYIYIYTYAH